MRKNAHHHKTLLRRRDNIIGSAKLIKSFDDQYDVEQANQVPLRIERLDELWRSFETVQDEIEVIEDSDQEFSDLRQEFHDMYFSLKASLITKLPTNEAPALNQAVPVAPPPPIPVMSVKLPELKIPEFDGQPEQWIEFRDLFKSVIHSNVQLSAVQKIHYLRSSLKGEASRLISSIPITANSYSIAWKAICDRYENTNYLVKQHMSALFRIPSIKKGSATALAELADEFNRHVGILDKLENPNRHWNSFLVERLSSLLDEKSLLEWESQCDEEETEYTDLLEFIHKRSRTLQKCAASCVAPASGYAKPAKGKASSSHVASEHVPKCPTCKQAHPITQCDAFSKLSQNQRLECAKKHRLCINCLRGGHMAKDCRSSLCRTCGKKHHSLLHLPSLTSASSIVETPGESESPVTSQACTVICPSTTVPTSQSDGSRSVVNEPSVIHAMSIPQVVSSLRSSKSSIDRVCPPSSSSVVSSDILEHEPSPTCLQQPAASLTQSNNARDSTVFLSTAVIRVKDVNDVYHFARAMLDSGSQSNFISESLCQKLNLKRIRHNLPVSGIGQAIVNVRYKVNLTFASRFGGFDQLLECLVLPKLTVNLPCRSVDITQWNIPNNLPLADPRFNICHGIDLIIGAELFYTLLETQRITLADEFPILQKTTLGYVVSGIASIQPTESVLCHVATNQELNAQLERMWEIEEFSHGKAFTPEEQQVEEHFIRTAARDESGRYVLRLPFRESAMPLLGDSYKAAVNRFLLMERRFTKDHELRQEYTEFIEDYIRLGHMEECSRVAGPQFFLPHHAIRRPDSTTTKTRVVFDASSKSHGQLSLNETLFTGPTVQPSLLAIVLNFRIPKYVFSADVEKMFRQVWIHPDDRRFLQVVWRPDATVPLKTYQLKTVTYGLACSPFQAARVLNKLADDEGDKFPLAAPIVTKCFYVDDVLGGGDDLDKTAESCRQLQDLLSQGGFSLRKWSTNHPKVLQQIPEELRGTSSLTEIGKSASTKALGLLWNPSTDLFGFQVPTLQPVDIITKRSVVSEMSQLFDPLGLLGPVVVSAKIFVQRLWAKQFSWDESLPKEETDWWKNFRSELVQLKNVTVSRCVRPSCNENYQLHCFCDASSKAYGCCVFVVGPNDRGRIECRLLIAKSRVAPLRGLSIPRLELCAAVLGSELVHNLLATTNFSSPVTFWSDSTVVLQWIQSPPNVWKVFVSNRIAEIQRLTRTCRWRYVPSSLNPADRISRGIQPSQIAEDLLWWEGPPFLSQSVDTWPESPKGIPSPNDFEEEKRATVVLTAFEVDDTIFERYSELGKLLKVVALCIRFGRNCRRTPVDRTVGNLNAAEVDEALKRLVRMSQISSFPKEIHHLTNKTVDTRCSYNFDSKSPLRNLNVFVDEHGLLRLDGRLKNITAPFDSKCPLILPAKHRYSLLIARSSQPTLVLHYYSPLSVSDFGRYVAATLFEEQYVAA